MTPEQWAAAIIVPVLAALLTYFGVRITSRRSMTVGREANAVTFSRDLIARVEGLENDVADLNRKYEELKGILSHATGWIEHCLRWVTGGRIGNPPRLTDKLKEQLNPWIVEDYLKTLDAEGDQGETQPPTHDATPGAL